MVLAHFILLMACEVADDLKAEFRQQFTAEKLDTTSLSYFGSAPGQLIKHEPEGLRLTLPGTQGKLSALGVLTRFKLHGDFEITGSYEVLGMAQPASGYGVGPSMYLRMDGRENSATLQRVLRPDGMNLYIQGRATPGPRNQLQNRAQQYPAEATTGKLRLTRTGATLHYLVAEGDAAEFRELGTEELGTDDIALVHIRLQSGDCDNAVADVRWRDLTVRAASFVNAQPVQAAAQPAQGPVSFTVNDEQITGNPTAIQDGKLLVATNPPRELPLDELLRVVLANKATVAAKWIGQDNQDLVQPDSGKGGNGIQDMHVALTGLLPGRQIKQIQATCLDPKRPGTWQLTGTPQWGIGLVQTGDSDTADLFMEPNRDNFDQDLRIVVTFADGTAASVVTRITTHTDPQLKVGAATPAAAQVTADPGRVRALVRMEGGDRIRGELLALGKDTLKLGTEWQAELEVPLVQVQAIEFGSSPLGDARARMAEQLTKRGAEDSAVVRAQDGAVSVVTGQVLGMDDGKLQFSFQGENRTISQGRLVGLVFADHPAPRAGLDPYQMVQLLTGERVSGTWTALDGEHVELQTAWGQRLRLARAKVSEIEVRNGKLVFLPDLEPASVEESPYFGRLLTYRRNQALDGGPLQMKGKTYTRGLAVHSRCVLTYAINGQFQSFKGLVGFDDKAGGRGRVLCRVLGDGKELFAEKDLRGDQDPKPLDVPVAGVKQLTLEVDFGEAEDTGDRVIWAEPRLFRSSAR